MKVLIASDLHGDADCVEKMLEIYDSLGCERLVILGDVLYHGPRNDLPVGYAPKRVIELLNARADDIIAIKGNCDAEVDEMVLKFKIYPEYLPLEINGISIVATHGHRYNPDNPPDGNYDLLLYGHTHVQRIEQAANGAVALNPGSVSIPKESNPRTVAILEDRSLIIIDLATSPINTVKF